MTRKVAVIIGANGAIGKSTSKRILKAGIDVVLVDKQLIEWSTSLTNAEPIVADISTWDGLALIEDVVKTRHKNIDYLINCAGINIRKPIAQYTWEDWDTILDVNLKSAFFIMQAMSKLMTPNGGKIVNVSSIQGSTCWNANGAFSLAPYCASKAGLIAISKAFALDLAKDNITVNTVSPGFVDTDLINPLKDNEDYYNDILRHTPLGRLATVDKVSDAIMFLIGNDYVTGHDLLIDGGWTI